MQCEQKLNVTISYRNHIPDVPHMLRGVVDHILREVDHTVVVVPGYIEVVAVRS